MSQVTESGVTVQVCCGSGMLTSPLMPVMRMGWEVVIVRRTEPVDEQVPPALAVNPEPELPVQVPKLSGAIRNV